MQKTAEKGIITIAFDDAYLDTYNHAIKHLGKLNIKSTIAMLTSFIGKRFENRALIGLKELKKMIEAGHEIASHTLTHPNLPELTSKDKNAAIDEISKSRIELQRLLNCRVHSFVFPYINKEKAKLLISETKPYYKSIRVTSNKPCFNKIPIKDPYKIEGFAVMKKHSLSYLNKQVDYAQKKGLWLIEVFHLVGKKNTLSAHRPKPYRFFMHIDDFKKHISYILSKNIMILPQNVVVKRFVHGI